MSSAPATRSLLVQWEDPAPLAEAFRRHGGLAMLQGVADGTLPPASMCQLLGFTLVEVKPGLTVWSGRPTEAHFNEAGLIHGGLASALLDTALGTTVLSTLAPGTLCAGLQLSVSFLRPLRPDTGEVRCEGRIVHRGSRVAVAEADLYCDEDERLLARATSTFSLMRDEDQ
jgi:uncharacterized protein (TIGR00369 family)